MAPRIEPFQAGSGQLSIPEGGAEAFNQVGRRSGQFYHQIGQDIGQGMNVLGNEIDKADTFSQVSHGAAAYSGVLASTTQQINQAFANSDPNDSTLPDKMRATVVEPAVQDFLKQFDNATPAAREWALNHADSMRDHFEGLVSAKGAFAAGEAADQNATVTQNNLAQMVEADPSAATYNMAKGTYAAALDTMIANHPNMDADTAMRLRTTKLQQFNSALARTAISSIAMKNPDAAEAAVKSGAFGDDVNGPETIAAIRQIGALRKSDAAQARVLQDYAERKASEQTAARMVSQFTVVDGHLVPPPNFNQQLIRAAASGSIKPSEFQSLANFGEGQQTKTDAAEAKAALDPAVYSDLIERMGAAQNGTTMAEVTAAYKGHHISVGQFNSAMNKFEGGHKELVNTIATNTLVGSEINKAYGQIIGTGDPSNGAYISAKAQFKADALRTMTDAAGNGEDWHAYIDPHDPKYLFTPERIKQYAPSPEEVRKGLVTRNMNGATVPGTQAPAGSRPGLSFTLKVPGKGQ